MIQKIDRLFKYLNWNPAFFALFLVMACQSPSTSSLEKSASPSNAPTCGLVLLHNMAAQNIPRFRQMIEKPACKKLILGPEGPKLLAGVITDGMPEALPILLSHGIDTSSPGEFPGWPALHLAARLEEPVAIAHLLKHGDSVKSLDDDGLTPLHGICSPDIIKILLKAGADPSAGPPSHPPPLAYLVEENCIPGVESLIQAGADVNGREKGEGTPLLKALAHNHPELATILLNQSADPSLATALGIAPLHVLKDPTLFPLLMEKGADLEAMSKAMDAGGTPLSLATVRDFQDLMKAFLEAGANANAQDSAGISPLHWSTLLGKERTDILLKAGANPNIQARNGETPLHYAVHQKNLASLESLMKAGGDSGKKDNSGQTPITLAEEFIPQTELTRALLSVLQAT